ncbi:MAG: PA2778 family cysteine peptidase [Rhizobacter sp.]|nr:PA2778 family cysteine peptidase [Rhizobacter sp.]
MLLIRPALLAAAASALVALAGCAAQTAALKATPPADVPRRVELVATPFFPQTDHLCGPAALATALGAVQLDVPPGTLAGEVFLPAREGSLQTEMLAGARRHGAVATRIPGTLRALLHELAAGHVVVVLQNLGLSVLPRWHYAVVVGYDLEAGELLMRSGATRRDRISLRTFEYTWARSQYWAFVALPPGEWPVTAEAGAAVEAAIGFERSAPPAQALRVYESAAARWPESLPLAIGWGTSAYATGDKARASAVFRAAAERHGSGAAWINLARVLQEDGQADAAREAAARAVGDPLWADQARALLTELAPAAQP